jgi:predicted amidohydrolase
LQERCVVKTLKAAAIQFDIQRGDLESNLATVKRRIHRQSRKGVKLMVLPEMWSVGFANRRLPELAKTTPRVLNEVRELASTLGVTVIGSLPEKRGSRIYNTAYAADADGSIVGTYRKVHLFSLTGEDKHFQRGRKAVIAQTSLGPIGLTICYDLRFPELFRALTLAGASIITVVAQWPAQRKMHWDLLLRTRALENQLFVIGVNRCGTDKDMSYGGHSRIVSPYGKVLARAGKAPSSPSATIDFGAIKKVRTHIPCLKERVPEAYVALK